MERSQDRWKPENVKRDLSRMIRGVKVCMRWTTKNKIPEKRREIATDATSSASCQNCKAGHLTTFRRTKIEDKTKEGNVCYVSKDGYCAFTIQSGVECSLIQGPVEMLFTGKRTRKTCSKVRKSSASHGSPPENGSKEQLNTAGEFEAELCQIKIKNVLRVLLLRRKGNANTQPTDLRTAAKIQL